MTSHTYDNVNRVASVTDAANKTTTFEYDALSRVTSLTDAINQQYEFDYYLPYEDPGELEAGVALSKGKRYEDIFTPQWFKEYCPCE